MKKFLSVLMALCLMLGMTPAQAEEAVDFTFWTQLESANYFTNTGENPAWYLAEEAVGINVEYINPSAAAGEEAFNLMIVSNELPDCILWDGATFPGGPISAMDSGVLMELSEDMLKEYAPNYWAYLEAYPEIKKMITTDDGRHYMIAGIMTWEADETKGLTPILEREPYEEAWLGLIVNRTALEKVNEEEPKTIEDLERVLTAFKEQLGMPGAFAPTLGYVKQSNAIAGAFDVAHGLYEDAEGKVHYGPAEDAYLDYITLLNKWYTNGLIDPDFSALDAKSSRSKFASGEAGLILGTGGWVGTVYDLARELDENSDLYSRALPMPTLNAEDEAPGYSLKNIPYKMGLGITTACKNPEKVLAFIDYYWTLEGSILGNWGVENVDFVYDANGLPVYPEGSEETPKINYILNGAFPMDMRNRLEMMKANDTVEPYLARGIWGNAERNCTLPPIVISTEYTMDYADIGNELSTYADEMFIKFVMGLEPLENFEQYRTNLKNMGLEQYIEIAQIGMDNYNAR